MLCCKELTTPLNKASTVVPVGENGFWFISSKFFVHDAKANTAQTINKLLFMVILFFLTRDFGTRDFGTLSVSQSRSLAVSCHIVLHCFVINYKLTLRFIIKDREPG